jgi:hypothetical protein
VRLGRAAQGVKALRRAHERDPLVDDWRRVSRRAELGHPAPDVGDVGVVVARLFGRRADAQRVDADGAALYLHLAPVDVGLRVE